MKDLKKVYSELLAIATATAEELQRIAALAAVASQMASHTAEALNFARRLLSEEEPCGQCEQCQRDALN